MTTYLLEAKWEKSPASRQDVDVLAQKVARKGRNTLGLFVAVSGFSEPAIRAHSDSGSGLIFIDGTDVYAVLDGQVALTKCARREAPPPQRDGGSRSYSSRTC
jgi:hypothetical protein